MKTVIHILTSFCVFSKWLITRQNTGQYSNQTYSMLKLSNRKNNFPVDGTLVNPDTSLQLFSYSSILHSIGLYVINFFQMVFTLIFLYWMTQMRRSSIGVIGTSEILKLKIYSRAADLRSQERYALSIQTYFIKEVIIIQKISTVTFWQCTW